jgi:hypothetical protein
MYSLEEAVERLTLQKPSENAALPLVEGRKDERADYVEVAEAVSVTEIVPFRFFDLPSEIRLKIYGFVLFGSRRKVALRSNGNVGSSSKNKPLAPLSHRLSLFLASRRLHDEAAALFYSVQTFRVFPIQDYSRLPTLSSLASSYRPLINKIELILGSSWTAPPKSWTVTDQLGLRQMSGVRTLKIFIQCDPSHPVFEGFRISNDFYTVFAGDILRLMLEQLPNLYQVEFDAWPAVQKNGSLMSRLLSEVRAAERKILWGPERGWSNLDDVDPVLEKSCNQETDSKNSPLFRAISPDSTSKMDGNRSETVSMSGSLLSPLHA